jgi:hypothetical protein
VAVVHLHHLITFQVEVEQVELKQLHVFQFVEQQLTQ